jgi:hypothetical protein
LDIILLVAAVVLWSAGMAEGDDVWSLFQQLLGVIALLVVVLGGRLIVLELAGLALALWLPGANSRRLLSTSYRSPESGQLNSAGAESGANPR